MKNDFKNIVQDIGNPDYLKDRKRDFRYLGNLAEKTHDEQEKVKNNFLEALYNKETNGKIIEILKIFPKGGALGKINGKTVFIGHNRGLNLEGKEGTVVFNKANNDFELEKTDKGFKVNLYGNYEKDDFIEGKDEVNYVNNYLEKSINKGLAYKNIAYKTIEGDRFYKFTPKTIEGIKAKEKANIIFRNKFYNDALEVVKKDLIKKEVIKEKDSKESSFIKIGEDKGINCSYWGLPKYFYTFVGENNLWNELEILFNIKEKNSERSKELKIINNKIGTYKSNISTLDSFISGMIENDISIVNIINKQYKTTHRQSFIVPWSVHRRGYSGTRMVTETHDDYTFLRMGSLRGYALELNGKSLDELNTLKQNFELELEKSTNFKKEIEQQIFNNNKKGRKTFEEKFKLDKENNDLYYKTRKYLGFGTKYYLNQGNYLTLNEYMSIHINTIDFKGMLDKFGEEHILGVDITGKIKKVYLTFKKKFGKYKTELISSIDGIKEDKKSYLDDYNTFVINDFKKKNNVLLNEINELLDKYNKLLEQVENRKVSKDVFQKQLEEYILDENKADEIIINNLLEKKDELIGYIKKFEEIIKKQEEEKNKIEEQKRLDKDKIDRDLEKLKSGEDFDYESELGKKWSEKGIPLDIVMIIGEDKINDFYKKINSISGISEYQSNEISHGIARRIDGLIDILGDSFNISRGMGQINSSSLVYFIQEKFRVIGNDEEISSYISEEDNGGFGGFGGIDLSFLKK